MFKLIGTTPEGNQILVAQPMGLGDLDRELRRRVARPVSFRYRNERGQVAGRNVYVLAFKFAPDQSGEGKRLLMQAFDLDRQEVRTFAVENIVPGDEI